MTDDDRDTRLAQYLSGYGRKVAPENLAAIDPDDPNAHLAKYLGGYGRLVVTSEKGEAPQDAVWPHVPYGYHMGRIRAYEDMAGAAERARPPQRIYNHARLAKYLREPERPPENDYSRGRERTRECE